MDNMEPNLHRMVEAHVRGYCLVATANAASGNPGEAALLTCAQAKRQLFCSSCKPCTPPNAIALALPNVVPSAMPPPPAIVAPPSAPPLTKKARANLTLWLDNFAIERWNLKDDPEISFLPHLAIWSGISQDDILNNFHIITSRESLNNVCADWKYLGADGNALFSLLEQLRLTLDEHTRKEREERNRKSAATRAKNKSLCSYFDSEIFADA